jgi:hypothetical protein
MPQGQRRMVKKAVQQGRRRIETGGVEFLTRPPELPRQLVSQVGYVEDALEARTKLAGFFSILLNRHASPLHNDHPLRCLR